MSTPSKWLANQRVARNPAVMDLISLAAARARKVLEREGVAHQRTLEQKISDQGPEGMRVDPHLLGFALRDLVERGLLSEHSHSDTHKWFSHRLEKPERVEPVLAKLAPLYAHVTTGHFPNKVGDALEVIVFKTIRELSNTDDRFRYFGSLEIDKQKNIYGRYRKNEPPQRIGENKTLKQADFLLSGYPEGILGIECKNYREWIYPRHTAIKDLIIKSFELNVIPILIARRIHYSTITNLLKPSGIVAHQSYFQYYPGDDHEIAANVRHKRSLGFTDVTSKEEPHQRTREFFFTVLPNILPDMAARWKTNKAALYEYAKGGLNIAQAYTAIGSPAGGKWKERGADEDPEDAELNDAYRGE